MIKTLMHKDFPVAKVEFSFDIPIKVLEIYNKEHMPPGIDLLSIENWNKNRCVPEERPNATLLCMTMGILGTEELAGKSHMASLTDCYWYASEKDLENHITWNDINPRNNELTNDVSKLLFDGLVVDAPNIESPDIATNGSLPKKWIQADDKFYLIKKDGHHHEVFNEVAASEIADALNISHVPYYFTYLGTEGEEQACISECFIKDDKHEAIDMNCVSWSGVVIDDDFLTQHNMAADYGKMKLFAYIINNADLHLRNISMIRDPDSCEYLQLSPNYDNGDSFYSGVVYSRYSGNTLREDAIDNIKYLDKPIDIQEIQDILYYISEEAYIDDVTLEEIVKSTTERCQDLNKEYELYHHNELLQNQDLDVMDIFEDNPEKDLQSIQAIQQIEQQHEKEIEKTYVADIDNLFDMIQSLSEHTLENETKENDSIKQLMQIENAHLQDTERFKEKQYDAIAI